MNWINVLGSRSVLRILHVLRSGPKTVTEVCRMGRMSYGVCSKNLDQMWQLSLISEERHGVVRIFSLSDTGIRLFDAIVNILGGLSRLELEPQEISTRKEVEAGRP